MVNFAGKHHRVSQDDFDFLGTGEHFRFESLKLVYDAITSGGFGHVVATMATSGSRIECHAALVVRGVEWIEGQASWQCVILTIRMRPALKKTGN